MSLSYLERYLNGEHEQVWQELVDLGPAVRQEPLYSEARAVAAEMMRRARHNVALIVRRLCGLGFHFAHEQRRTQVPDPIGHIRRTFSAAPELVAQLVQEIQSAIRRRVDLPAEADFDLERDIVEIMQHYADPFAQINMGDVVRSNARPATDLTKQPLKTATRTISRPTP